MADVEVGEEGVLAEVVPGVQHEVRVVACHGEGQEEAARLPPGPRELTWEARFDTKTGGGSKPTPQF